MPLSAFEMLGMMLRQTPVLKIRKALALCEAAGIPITANELERHHLCGKDPLVLAEALVTAKELGVNTTFQEMSAIHLVGHHPSALLLEASTDRTATITTFSAQREDRIRGFTQDHQQVFAAITVVYRLALHQLAFGFDFRQVHERLAAAASVFINTAPDLRTLQHQRRAHEAELKSLILETLPGVQSVAIEYR